MSNVGRVDGPGIAQLQQTQQQEVQDVAAKRLEVYDTAESFSRGGSSLSSYQDVTAKLPEEQRAGMENLLGRMSPEQAQAFFAQSEALAGQLLACNGEGDTLSAISGAMGGIAETTGATDSETLTMDTLLCAYQGVQGTLEEFALKIQGSNVMKQEVREELTMLRDMLSDWPEGETRTITYSSMEKQPDGSYKMVEHTETLTKKDAENLIEKMETDLNSLSDISQMDNLKLQQIMEQQAQLMQTMSNIMKAINDAAKAIIGNMR